jgi:D-lactate dehydrogenase (cytochrome)
MLDEHLIRSLTNLLGQSQVVTDPVELITYEIDAGLDQGTPDGLVFVQSTEDVVRVARWAAEANIPLIARGAGTGLSGGAVPERGGVIVEFSRMNRVLDFDPRGRSAVVEPGVVNLELDELAKAHGLYFPPDPASGRASTIGGNVAVNAGGPHCFKYGVTSNYVTGLEVVLAEGRIVHLGGRALDYPEYDLCGLLTGSEGTLGIVTRVDVRLVRNPPGVKTMMAIFDSVEQAGAAVSAVIAAGLVPATMEMMDRKIVGIIEEYAHAGLPTDAAAVLIIEVDGYQASLDSQIEEVARIVQGRGGRNLQIARSAEEREKIWYARKSAAGAISRLAPAYYLVDITVPRSRLAEALAEVNHICDDAGLRVGYVFHAGDGNLHPLILIPDPEDAEFVEKVHRAGHEIVKVGIGKDGSITGEHGVGIEKREYMALMYSGTELAAMWDVKQTFDPRGLMNPGKVFPTQMPEVTLPPAKGPTPDDTWAPVTAQEAARGLAALAAASRPVYIAGSSAIRSQQSAVGGQRSIVVLSTAALTGIKAYAPEDLYVTVAAGTPLAEVQSFLARDGMQVPLASPWPGSTIGGIVAANLNAPLRMRYGSVRDLVLAMTVVLGDGRVIRAGRPVVKNVAGYDLPKVFVGSHGTLGLITDVTLKITPLPRARRTLLVPVDDLSRGLAWAAQVLPLALVASAIVLCKGCDAPQVPGTPYLLAYTAEGWPEDVESELEQVRQVLQAKGAPSPVEAEEPSGTDLWIKLLSDEDGEGLPPEGTLQVRAGVAPRDLAAYVEARADTLEAGRFLADVASGLVYASITPASAKEAHAWLDGLRQPALAAGGYAVVMSTPDGLDGALDRWGYEPEAMDVMRRLKARWDPAGILNPGVFVL